MSKDIYKDMLITFDVCGSEIINSAPESGSSLDLVFDRNLKIEKGS
jgi:hypothetical protein